MTDKRIESEFLHEWLAVLKKFIEGNLSRQSAVEQIEELLEKRSGSRRLLDELDNRPEKK